MQKNIQSTEKEISVKGTVNNAKVFELSCWQSRKNAMKDTTTQEKSKKPS